MIFITIFVTCALVQGIPFFSSKKKTCPDKWTLYENGNSADGTTVLLPSGLENKNPNELAAWAASHVGKFGANCFECALYDATGRRLKSCADGEVAQSVAEGEGTGENTDNTLEIWVVAPRRWFIFPFGMLGRAVPVARVTPPRGSSFPITVETIRWGMNRLSSSTYI